MKKSVAVPLLDMAVVKLQFLGAKNTGQKLAINAVSVDGGVPKKI